MKFNQHKDGGRAIGKKRCGRAKENVMEISSNLRHCFVNEIMQI